VQNFEPKLGIVQEPIEVRNLVVNRDFIDVRDIAIAYWNVLLKGKA